MTFLLFIENTFSIIIQDSLRSQLIPTEKVTINFTATRENMNCFGDVTGSVVRKKKHFQYKSNILGRKVNKYLTKTTESLCMPFFVSKNMNRTVTKEFIFKNPRQSLYQEPYTQLSNRTKETSETKQRKFMKKLLFRNRVSSPIYSNLLDSSTKSSELMESSKIFDFEYHTTPQQNQYNIYEDPNNATENTKITTTATITRKINKVNNILKHILRNELKLSSNSSLLLTNNSTNEKVVFVKNIDHIQPTNSATDTNIPPSSKYIKNDKLHNIIMHDKIFSKETFSKPSNVTYAQNNNFALSNETTQVSNETPKKLQISCVESDFLLSGEIKENLIDNSKLNESIPEHKSTIIIRNYNSNSHKKNSNGIGMSFIYYTNDKVNEKENNYKDQINIPTETSNEHFQSRFYSSSLQHAKKSYTPKRKWSHIEFKKFNKSNMFSAIKHKSANAECVKVKNNHSASLTYEIKESFEDLPSNTNNYPNLPKPVHSNITTASVKTTVKPAHHLNSTDSNYYEKYLSLPLPAPRGTTSLTSPIVDNFNNNTENTDRSFALVTNERIFNFQNIFRKEKKLQVTRTPVFYDGKTTIPMIACTSQITKEIETQIPPTIPMNKSTNDFQKSEFIKECSNTTKKQYNLWFNLKNKLLRLQKEHTNSINTLISPNNFSNSFNITNKNPIIIENNKNNHDGKFLKNYKFQKELILNFSTESCSFEQKNKTTTMSFSMAQSLNCLDIEKSSKKLKGIFENQSTNKTSLTNLMDNSSKIHNKLSTHKQFNSILRFFKINTSDKIEKEMFNTLQNDISNHTTSLEKNKTISFIQDENFYTCSTKQYVDVVVNNSSKTNNIICYNYKLKENKLKPSDKPLPTGYSRKLVMHSHLNKGSVDNRINTIQLNTIDKWNLRNEFNKLKYNYSKYRLKNLETSERNLFKWFDKNQNPNLSLSTSNYKYSSPMSINQNITTKNNQYETIFYTTSRPLINYCEFVNSSQSLSNISKTSTIDYSNRLSLIPFKHGINSTCNLKVSDDKNEKSRVENNNITNTNKFLRFLLRNNINISLKPKTQDQNIENIPSISKAFSNTSNKIETKYFNHNKNIEQTNNSNSSLIYHPEYADYFNPYLKKNKSNKIISNNLTSTSNNNSFQIMAYILRPLESLVSVFQAIFPNNVTKLADVNTSVISNGSFPALLAPSNSSIVILAINDTNDTSKESHEAPNVGLLDLLGGWFHCVMETYVEPKAEDIHFYLYTRDNLHTPEELLLPQEIRFTENSTNLPEPVFENSSLAEVLTRKRRRQSEESDEFELLNPAKTEVHSKWFNILTDTKILIHGYIQDYQTDIMVDMKDAYLTKGPLNVILVDWSVIGDNTCYPMVASKSLRRIGILLTRLLDELVSGGVSLARVHLVGFSLGAHVAGHAGSELTHGLVGRITGLDPALPYIPMERDMSLDSGDAAFVDIIHSAAGYLGQPGPMGHADFYPNGGSQQPGCDFASLGTCSHRRSALLFIESINSENGFYTKLCDSWESFQEGHCNHSETVLMGDDCPTNSSGKYYLFTGFKEPFALLPEEHVKVKKSLWFDLFYGL